MPLAAIPSIARTPEGKRKVRAVAASVVASLPKQPGIPNFYQADLTDSQYSAIGKAIDAYVARMQTTLSEKLAAVVGG